MWKILFRLPGSEFRKFEAIFSIVSVGYSMNDTLVEVFNTKLLSSERVNTVWDDMVLGSTSFDFVAHSPRILK